MQITVQNASLAEVKCDVVIVNLFDDVKIPSGATGAIDKALDGLIAKEVIEIDKFKAKLGSTTVLPTYTKIPARKVVIVGLGKREKFDINSVRKAAAEAIKACKKLKAEKVCSILHGAGTATLPAKMCAQAITEGSILANYSFDKYKTQEDKEDENNDEAKIKINEFTIVEYDSTKLKDIEDGIKIGEAIANATNFARDLVTEPASFMTPSKLAEKALEIGLECRIFDQPEIEAMGMNAFLGVARGSAEPPKFIRITYKPESTPTKRIAIVGKGLTFDSGGLDLKTSAGMLDMKMDMSGAAAVLGIMKALKTLKVDVEVMGIVPACENMPDGNSYKPGDVLKAKSGKTIEVNNTDAEGRLILADALCYAVEQKPDEIIDLATLTGAVVIALGSYCAAIMGNNQDIIDKFMDKTKNSGEKLWQLPLFEEYKKYLKSDIADIKNAGSREAGSSVGGMFLQEFVDDTPWTHLDIAGAVMLDKDFFENPKGYTGFGVRSVLYYLL